MKLRKLLPLLWLPVKGLSCRTGNSYENVEPKLDEFTKDIEKDPVDATVVSFDSSSGTFSYKDGKNGLKVDHDKLLEDVMAILKGDKVGTVEVPTEVVEFDKTKAEVAAHMQKLGTFSTYSTTPPTATTT